MRNLAKLISSPGRSINLFLIAAVRHITRVVAAPIAFLLMSVTLELPFWTSLILLGSSLITLLVFWKLFVKFESSASNKDGVLIVQEEDHDDDSTTQNSLDLSPIQGPNAPLMHTVSNSDELGSYRSSLKVLFKRTQTIFRGPVMIFALGAFFFKKIAFVTESFIFQYASETFQWELRSTSILRVALSGGAVAATLVIWPIVSWHSTRKGYPKQDLSFRTINVSLTTAFISFSGAWLASSKLLLEIGTLPITCRLRFFF